MAETIDEIWDAYNDTSFDLDEIISDTKNFTWATHLNTFGLGSVHYMMNPGNQKLTPNAETSLTIKLNGQYVYRMFEEFGSDFPLSYLYDPRYDRMAPNLINIPYENPDTTKFITSTKALIYLEVR